jgi:hypothetical protein
VKDCVECERGRMCCSYRHAVPSQSKQVRATRPFLVSSHDYDGGFRTGICKSGNGQATSAFSTARTKAGTLKKRRVLDYEATSNMSFVESKRKATNSLTRDERKAFG